jgi:hypothetical protein
MNLKQDERTLTGFIWVRQRTSDGISWTRQWIFGFSEVPWVQQLFCLVTCTFRFIFMTTTSNIPMSVANHKWNCYSHSERQCSEVRCFSEWTVFLVLCHAKAQAVSRWPPTAAARARGRVRSCGIYGRQCGTKAGFALVLRFPLPITPPTAPHSSSSSIIHHPGLVQ